MPGYTAFYLFRWLSYLEERWSDRDILYLSLMVSVLIYIVTGNVFHLKDFNEIKNLILIPRQASFLLLITLLLGVIPGGLARLWLIRNDVHPGNVWVTRMNEFRSQDEDVWLLVYTTDGKEYKGTLDYFDAGEEPNSISIKRPIQILRDDDFRVTEEFEMGEEIIFKEHDISRVVSLSEVE